MRYLRIHYLFVCCFLVFIKITFTTLWNFSNNEWLLHDLFALLKLKGSSPAFFRRLQNTVNLFLVLEVIVKAESVHSRKISNLKVFKAYQVFFFFVNFLKHFEYLIYCRWVFGWWCQIHHCILKYIDYYYIAN